MAVDVAGRSIQIEFRIPLDYRLRQLRLLARLPSADSMPDAVPLRSTIRRLVAFERHRDADELRLEPVSTHRDQSVSVPTQIHEMRSVPCTHACSTASHSSPFRRFLL